MAATTKNAPGIRGNGPEGSDHNPTHQDGAEVMSTVPQTTDQKIDAALKPNIVTEDWDEFADGTWQQNHFIRLTPGSGVDVLRMDTRDRDGNVTIGEWTVFIDDTSGVLKSTSIARLIAADLEAAAQLADRLNAEEAGR